MEFDKKDKNKNKYKRATIAHTPSLVKLKDTPSQGRPSLGALAAQGQARKIRKSMSKPKEETFTPDPDLRLTRSGSKGSALTLSNGTNKAPMPRITAPELPTDKQLIATKMEGYGKLRQREQKLKQAEKTLQQEYFIKQREIKAIQKEIDEEMQTLLFSEIPRGEDLANLEALFRCNRSLTGKQIIQEIHDDENARLIKQYFGLIIRYHEYGSFAGFTSWFDKNKDMGDKAKLKEYIKCLGKTITKSGAEGK